MAINIRIDVIDNEIEMPLGEFLEHASGCAYAAGFLAGFAAAQNGENEPDMEEIERRYYEAEKDSVLALKLKGLSDE